MSQAKDNQLILKQLVAEASSKSLHQTEKIRSLFAEAGLVNLWFFLRCIASVTGPFEKLDLPLHMEMCNVRQGWMQKGLFGAAFLPRDFYKTTIFTIGGDAWEAARDGNVRIKIVNAVFDRAQAFMHTIQRVFDGNPFLAWIYPHMVPEKGAPRWNDKEMVMPNRTRHYNEPTVKPAGVGAASEGDHPDLLSLDDLIGLEDLNSMMQSGATMESAKRWLSTNLVTSLDWQTGRCILTATRYAIDDAYSIPWKDCKTFTGFTMEPIKPKESGKWHVYNRLVEEHGVITNPLKHNQQTLAKIKAEDPWTAMTQLYNSPQLSGLTEFSDYPDQLCSLIRDPATEEWLIRKEAPDGKEVRRKLSKMDVRGGFDPAATDRGITARTSRSAVAIWAQDWERSKYLLFLRCGYVKLETAYDWLFEAQAKFEGLIAEILVESNAFQKILKDELRKEGARRGEYVYFNHKASITDKDARIRSRLGPEFQRNRIWLVEGEHNDFIAEKNAFPQSNLKDVLDASEKAFSILRVPMDPGEGVEAKIAEQQGTYDEERSAVSGY